MPGAGKSFTMAMVVSQLQENFKDDLVTYVYCTYQNHVDDTPSDGILKILGSLLRVIIQQLPTIPKRILHLYDKYNPKSRSLSRDEIFKEISDIFEGPKQVYLLVDALDELPDSVRRQFVADLLKLSGKCSLFLTSRNINEIQRPFSERGALSLEIRASDEDLRQYLEDQSFQLRKFVHDIDGLKENIFKSIIEASSGMLVMVFSRKHQMLTNLGFSSQNCT
jgi:hypothetical protein